MIHLAEINARLTAFERKYLNIVLRSDGGAVVTEELLALSVPDAVALVKESVERAEAERNAARVADAPDDVPAPTELGDFTSHVMAVSAFLDAEERAAVLWLLPRFPADRTEQLKAELLRMSPEEAAVWIRENLESLRAEVGS